jgi:hypothetical protein
LASLIQLALFAGSLSVRGRSNTSDCIICLDDVAGSVDWLNANIATEVVMLVPADALALDRARADEAKPRQAVAPSVQDRCDASALDKPQIGRDSLPPYNHRGTIVVASAWLAFYVILAIHHFMSSGN